MSKEEMLLLSVEDLIHRSIGNAGQNSGHVDFKGIQTILHLLARQMRMLEQKVEIQVDEFYPDTTIVDEFGGGFSTDETSTRSTQVKGKQDKRGQKDKGKQFTSVSEKSDQRGAFAAEDQKVEDGREDQIEEDEGGAFGVDDNVATTTDTLKTKKASERSKVTQGAKKDIKTKEKGIVVTEKTSKDDKILVVERKTSVSGVSSGIDVVTRSQFEVVAEAVRELQALARPPPPPTLPANQQLRRDMQEGRASLADTMNAMNVNARVEAAESAIDRLSSLVTQLTQTTRLPGNTMTGDGVAPPRSSQPSTARASTAVTAGFAPNYVTHEDMEIQFQAVRDYLLKALNSSSQRSTSVADNAFSTVRTIGDKMDIAVRLNSRVGTLYSRVSDYAEQLKGFDSGIGKQLSSFQDQMTKMAEDLRAGLDLMEKTHHNAENAAIIELTERYEGLVLEMDQTLSAHQQLSSNQGQLAIEIKSLVEWVEMLREQKADRDEVLDALRDKADLNRLTGLLTEDKFADMKIDLDNRLQLCYDKFSQQEEMWLKALKELSEETDTKADSIHLYLLRDDSQRALQALHDLALRLEQQLGEPKAAMLLREICRGAVCAACTQPALINPGGDYAVRANLPGFTRAVDRDRDRSAGGGDEQRVPLVGHRCNRWVGGSHTLLVAERVHRARAAPLQVNTHSTRYYGYGEDGQLYHLEETCGPCVECNPPSERDRDTQLVGLTHTCTPKRVPIATEEIVLNKEDVDTETR